MSNRPINVRIRVINLTTEEVEQEHVTNVARFSGREFLRRLQFHAWNNNKGVATELDTGTTAA